MFRGRNPESLNGRHYAGITPVTHALHSHNEHGVIHRVDNAVVSHPNTVGVIAALELPTAIGAWVLSQRLHGIKNCLPRGASPID